MGKLGVGVLGVGEMGQRHAENLRRLPNFLESQVIYADPSIFYRTQAQSEGDFRSLAELYWEAGLSGLTRPLMSLTSVCKPVGVSPCSLPTWGQMSSLRGGR